MNIIKLLKSDHKELRSFCDKMLATSEKATKTRAELFEHFSALLNAHARAEEDALYEKIRKFDNVHDQVMESFEEHHLADLVNHELEPLSPSDEHWKPKLSVLSETLDHHIKEEETVLFPKVQRLLSEDELEKCGVDFSEKKIFFMERSSGSPIHKMPGELPPVFRP